MPRHSSTIIHHQPPSSKTYGPSCGAAADRDAVESPGSRGRRMTATIVTESAASSLYQRRHTPSGQRATAASMTRSLESASGPRCVHRGDRPRRTRRSCARSPGQRSGTPSISVRYMRQRIAVVDDLGRPVRPVDDAPAAGLRAGSRPAASGSSVPAYVPRDAVARAGDADAAAVHPGHARVPGQGGSRDAACRTSTTCRRRSPRSGRSRRRTPGRDRARRRHGPGCRDRRIVGGSARIVRRRAFG